MESLFDMAMVRFGTSGTLILVYGLADGFARRAAGAGPQRLPESRGMRVLLFVSITAFYVLIGPAGGPIAGGLGNLAGILLVVTAALLRIATRHGHPRVRYPQVATRVLFYIALPLAVGVPFGWLALTLPATAASAFVSIRADREAGVAAAPRSFRWVPGLW